MSFAVYWKQSAQCDSGWVSQGRILPESSNQEYHGVPYACCVTLRDTSWAGSFRVFASTEWILAVYWVCLPTCGDTGLQRLTSPCGHGHTHTAHTATAVHSTQWAMLGVCSDLGPALWVEVPVLSTSQHPAPRFSLDGHSLDLSFDDSQCFALLSSSRYYELLWLPRGLDTQSDNLNIGKENHWILTVLGDKSKIKITILERRKNIRCWIRFENQQTYESLLRN